MEDNNDEIDWEEIILLLNAYTRSLVNGLGWFRGKNTQNFIGGKEIEDYVFEAIGRYLRNPKLYDPEKGSLLKFLKYYLIRSLVSNDLVSSENKTSTNLSIFESTEDDENTYEEKCMGLVEAHFDEEIDYSDVMMVIRESVSHDKLLENIFKGTVEENLKRREIIEIYEISASEYDNGMRRLKTILKSVAKQFDIKKLT